jgi:hypothetical protein
MVEQHAGKRMMMELKVYGKVWGAAATVLARQAFLTLFFETGGAPAGQGFVTARIGFSVDSDLHEKLLRRIGSRWSKNHVESDLCFCLRSIFFLFSVQNEFVVHSKTLSPILHGEIVI